MRRWLLVLALAGCGAPTVTTDAQTMDATASGGGDAATEAAMLDAASEEGACSPACAAGQICVGGACFAPVDAARDVATDAQPTGLVLSAGPEITLFPMGGESLHASLRLSDRSSVDVTTLANWSTSNPMVLSLMQRTLGTDTFMEVRALSYGTANVIAMHRGFSAQARVVVRDRALRSISLNPVTAMIRVGEFVRMSAVGTFEDDTTAPLGVGSGVIWVSSASGVANANAQGSAGLVVGVGAGTAMVTARVGMIVSAPAIITVNP
jgi:hypothetical protein